MALRGLLERDRELGALDALAAGAARGEGRLALVEGAAGIGKSRLLAEARERAGDSMRVLSARGSELEREFPFGVVRQLFEPVLADPAEREAALAGAARPAAAVFGSLGTERESSPDPSFAVLHGLYWIVANLAESRPTLLAVDDLHWCDRPTLRFVAYLARRLDGLPVLVVTGLRTAEPGSDPALIAEIAQDPHTRALRPAPLGEESVAALVRERLGDDADASFCRACQTATGGNPLLLSELLHALEVEGVMPDAQSAAMVGAVGPRAASRAVLLRLARLPGEAASMARAVAVLGDRAPLPASAAVAELSEEDAALATGHLARAEILRSDTPLSFVHPLVRDAVYNDMPPGERELWHWRATDLLSQNGAATEQVAAQLLAAPGRGQPGAVAVLRRAADEALEKGAAENAAAYLSRALDEPAEGQTRTDVLLELGLVEALANDPGAAIEHLSSIYERLDDPAARFQAAQILARMLQLTGEAGRAAALARRAADELPGELTDLRRALEAVELMSVIFGAPPPDAFERLERYREDRGGPGIGDHMLAAVAALEWAYSCGPADRCAELALHALSGGQLLEFENGFLSVPPTVVLTMADRDEAPRAWEDSLAEAHRRGALFSASAIRLWHGYTLAWRGDLEEAERSVGTARQEFESGGYGRVTGVYSSAFLSAIRREAGELAAARRTLEQADDPGDGSDAARYWVESRLELLVAEERDEEAVALADEFATRFPRSPNPAVGAWRSLKATALARLGRDAEARALLDEELELARRWGSPSVVGRTLRTIGETCGDRARLEEALSVLEGSSARLELAKTLGALGAAVRDDDQAAARDPLRRAFELATVCGANGLAERVRADLYATGARPARQDLAGLESLTSSERRVADLAADGATNKDIAQTLYVTPKTVENHLSGVYRKLGIRSRRELPAALGRE
jgi:DNA-binding CsgD family transcriptional regulator/tetratricopeptide (TPR) repeat protein